MYKKYGLTLRGLIIEREIDPEPFLEYVHDVNFNDLAIDYDLKKLLGEIKGKKLIYTNASYKHAKNILTSMGIFEEFEKIFDIKDSNYVAKPEQTSYLIMKEKFGLDNESIKRSIFFEDTAKNLKPASELGMSTVWIEMNLTKMKQTNSKNILTSVGQI